MRERRAVLLLGACLAVGGCGGAAPPTPAGPPASWRPVPGQVAVEPSASARVRHAEPVEVAIPSLGVRSRLERLVLDGRGELTTPRSPGKAGWYGGGVRPGDQGPAVIAGHVDSRTGPAVFARLARVRAGAEVTVRDARGRTARFRVDAVETHAKAAFPTARVYGATPDPQLRLITCGGAFDGKRGHYTDNVVVYATLT